MYLVIDYGDKDIYFNCQIDFLYFIDNFLKYFLNVVIDFDEKEFGYVYYEFIYENCYVYDQFMLRT